MDAPCLLELLKKVIDSLLDRGVRVVSYASDGTEIERAVQRLFLDLTNEQIYTIQNPRPGCVDTKVVFGIYRGQAICMVQDSKHALKTFRNNLFSGARLLTFGNYTAMYRHILEIAQGDGTPLFSRDVNKVDRQDDNAASRLFSADILQYLAVNHPEYIGDIVYLFVFGELVDAYQNRSMSHVERLRLVLRARYFLDSWEAYLRVCGYRKDQYCLSREALDITRIIINGFIALVIIHRDHTPGTCVLLPWLHSSEACEHVFGESRQVVKDFTYLDFIYMIPKLRIKLHQAAFRGKASNPKARAAGYAHTYFDNDGLDWATLSTFPTNSEIQAVAEEAAQEADSLVALLGINAERLHRFQASNPQSQWLPAINSWFRDDDLGGVDQNIECDLVADFDAKYDYENEAEELQKVLDQEENSPITRSRRLDEKCMNLTAATLALAADETIQMFVHCFLLVCF